MIKLFSLYFCLGLLIIWISQGIYFSRFNYQELIKTDTILNRFSIASITQKNLFLYGSIYLAIQQLQPTPKTTSILFLTPDQAWVSRLVIFLYPRKIQVVADPASAINYLLKNDYDYVLIYAEKTGLSGFITNLNEYQRKYWDTTALVNLVRLIYQNNNITENDMMELFVQNYGVILRQL